MPTRATVDQRLDWHLAHERACACRPMPAPLEALDAERTRTRLRALFDGGDGRSLGQSAAARTLVEARAPRTAALASLATHANWVVSMRALDLLEKLAHEHADWVQPHRRVFLTAASTDRWLILLQVVRALPLLKWTARERIAVIGILQRGVRHNQTFVRAWSLDSLSRFALEQPSLLSRVRHALAAFERSTRPALRARARHIRARIETRRSPR
jgi:hypothetical protein